MCCMEFHEQWCTFQFLDVNPSSRLGCSATGRSDIEGHAFFSGLSWKAAEERTMEPPIKPEVRGRELLYVDPALADLPPVASP